MRVIPSLRKQIKEYEREGFHVVAIENRAGSHKMLIFAEFPEPQVVTISKSDWRALKNNIARFRRLAEQYAATAENT